MSNATTVPAFGHDYVQTTDAELEAALYADRGEAPVVVDAVDQAQDAAPSPFRNQPLRFETIPELRARVEGAGPRQWLVRGLWPAGTYGVHAAEQKAQKTWNALDLAVSVASGTPWLGHFAIDSPGPVVVCMGEGGAAAVLHRLDAIAGSRGIVLDSHSLVVCDRTPHLDDGAELSVMHEELSTRRPALTVVDPFYLAARTAKPGDVFAMGQLLGRAQALCASVGSALFVVHHYNRQREARGPHRMSGAGPAEWGRVLIGADVVTRYVDAATRQTRVTTELDVIGSEVAESRFRGVTRTIHSDNPDDLDSPLHYSVSVVEVDDDTTRPGALPDAKPSEQWVYAVLLDAAGAPLTVQVIGDRLAEQGHPLKKRTIQAALNELGERVDGVQIDARGTTEWWAKEANDALDK